ncbi:hypothetical protein GCM10025876_09240 [Demequina litorisediminis]|uniref:Uncharacterized protein n=1 Tax=Demequina litorisediminis TaxID=1849022 RepID=A0ABQ6IA71_9MICO|nr:hypothetical protein GCM10025876_09240 [Demequina litorisediminis]
MTATVPARVVNASATDTTAATSPVEAVPAAEPITIAGPSLPIVGAAGPTPASMATADEEMRAGVGHTKGEEGTVHSWEARHRRRRSRHPPHLLPSRLPPALPLLPQPRHVADAPRHQGHGR